MILTVTVIDSTGITVSGDQTEISVVNPATSVTYNPIAPFTASNVQDALPQAHKMIGEQSNNYSVILDYGNKFEIQSGSDFARFFASAGAGGFAAGLSSSDKITFGADGNLTASLDGSGSTFYDKLLVQGNPSQSVGLIQTNNTSGSQQHHLVMKNSGADVGFLGSDGDSALLGIGSASVALTSLGLLGGNLSPATQYGGTKNGVIDLGKTNSRFRDLYLSDNLYADGVSFEDANITFTSDQFILNNASNNNLITTTNQGVNLKYNGVQRLATTNSGVSISGSLDATTGNIANLNASGTVSAGSAVVSGSVSVGGTVDGRDLSVDGDKLDNIESNATADQTDAEIRAAVDAATDSNVYTDAEKAKLTGIESGATADQTDAEIRSAVASATNSNVFTDSEKTKLSGAAELDSSPTFTGTVSSAGLAVDTDTLYVDETNERVGINTASPDYNLVVADTGTSTVQIKAGNANYSQLNFGDTDDNDIGQIAYIHDSNEMRFTTNNSQAMVIDSSGDVGIGTTNPASKLHVQGTGTTAIQVTGGSSNVAGIYLGDAGGLANGRLSYSNADNSLQLFTNNTERMRINASGKVGIGTTSPDVKLDVTEAYDTVANVLSNGSYAAKFSSSGSGDTGRTQGILLSGQDGNSRGVALLAEAQSTGNSHDFIIATSSSGATPTERMRINASGNVGIGTSSPANTLTVGSTENSTLDQDATVGIKCNANHKGIILQENSGAEQWSMGVNADGNLNFYDSAIATPAVTFEDLTGNVGIGTTSPAESLHTAGNIRLGDTSPAELYTNSNELRLGVDKNNDNDASNITFYTNNDEKVRIDSSGNVLVGKTASSLDTTGIQLQNDGLIRVTKNNTDVLQLNRQSSDGAIVNFYKDGSTVGSIGVALSDNLYFSGVDSGIGCGTGAIYPASTTGQPSDNETNLGTASTRFKDLYLSGGIDFGGAVNSGGTVSSSNKLDDYEEGTWTPAFIGSTSGSASYTPSQAHYTKIGNQVYFQCYVTNIRLDTHNIVGEVQISGLPFTSAKFGRVQVGFTNLTTANEITNHIAGYTSGSVVSLRKGSATTAITNSDLITSITSIMVSGVYTTNS